MVAPLSDTRTSATFPPPQESQARARRRTESPSILLALDTEQAGAAYGLCRRTHAGGHEFRWSSAGGGIQSVTAPAARADITVPEGTSNLSTLVPQMRSAASGKHASVVRSVGLALQILPSRSFPRPEDSSRAD